jgi:hypothetical protein
VALINADEVPHFANVLKPLNGKLASEQIVDSIQEYSKIEHKYIIYLKFVNHGSRVRLSSLAPVFEANLLKKV